MSEEKILTRIYGQVLVIGLNRPAKRNAFDLEMFSQLASALGRLDRERELRCGLLHAAGSHFTGGLDLAQWAPVFAAGRFPDLSADQRDPFGLDPDKRLSKPLVVAVQGICYTIGIELMLAADVRVAASDCRFGQIEVKRGIYPVGGATLRMVQECGWGNAQRWLLTGDEFDAAEAYRIGLVQEVCTPGESFDRALAIATRIADAAPLGVAASLKSSRLSVEHGPRAAIERLLPDLAPIMKSQDAAEGLRSFTERRPARFSGR